MNFPKLQSGVYTIRFLELTDIDSIINFYKDNKEHFSAYENINDNYFTHEFWKNKIIKNQEEFIHDKSCCFGIFDNGKLIGQINFSHIIRVFFQSCYLGYKIDKNYQSKGIMKNCLKICIDYVFKELNLHRISANYMPTNIKSKKLLASLGFKKEGMADKYLYINGKWEEHMLNSLINENWKADFIRKNS